VVDLHVHILPGIDDGPPDLAGSLALARAAEADGIQIVAATPHLREDHPRVHPEQLAGRCVALNEALAAGGVAVEVVPGAEVDVLWAQEASPEQLRLASFGQNGTDMLVETPYGALGPGFDAGIDRLLGLGFRVLLAHPERNRTFQQAPERVAELVERGVLIQVTAGSLASRRRDSGARVLARWLVEHKLAHVLASDAHRGSDVRVPNLSAGVAEVRAIDGARARWMVVDVPLAILSGGPVPRPQR
jgi:protein-tyrosine phosphatase